MIVRRLERYLKLRNCRYFASDTSKGKDEPKEVKCNPMPGTGGGSLCIYKPPPGQGLECQVNAIHPEAIPIEQLPLEPPWDDIKVVIIGAGLAGLTAARRLISSGLTNTTILEASSRPGGRIKSTVMGGTLVELGSAGLSSPSSGKPHPLVGLASSLGGVSPCSCGDTTFGLLELNDGTPMSMSTSLNVYLILKGIIEKVQPILQTISESDKRTLQEYVGVQLRSALARLSPKEAQNALRALAAIGGGPLLPRSLVSDNIASFVVLPGGLRVPLGNTSMIAAYLEDIGAERIQYNKNVTKIKWGTVTPEQRPRAVLSCADGSHTPADYVIVTIPLGVLKDEATYIFEPNLPTDKTAAIREMKNEMKEKIFVKWAVPIWVWRDSEILNKTWAPKEMESRKDWTKTIISVKEVPASEHMLEIVVGGPHTQEYSYSDDKCILKTVTEFIREWQGDTRIPDPVEMKRTQWLLDPYYRGSTACPQDPENALALMTPVPNGTNPILYFAGDATTPGACGSITGAIISGFREAENIVKVVKDEGKENVLSHPCLTTCCVKA